MPRLILSHAERRERREKMAKEIARNFSPAVVARRYKVTVQTVKHACREFDVPWPEK